MVSLYLLVADDGESDGTIEGDEPSGDEDESNDEPSNAGQSVNKSSASSKYSPLNKSLMSIGLSPVNSDSYRSSIDPTRDSIVTDISSKRDSAASTLQPGSSRRGSRGSTRLSESGLDVSGGDVNESEFDADVSNPMADTTTLSEFQYQQKSGRGSGAAKGRPSLATPVNKSKPTADNSLDLSGAKSKTGTGNRSDRRVSFGNNSELSNLSPIAGTLSEAGTVSSKRSAKDSSCNTTKNTTIDTSVDDSVNTTKNTTKNTTMNSSRNTTVRSSAGKSSVAANESAEDPSLEQSPEMLPDDHNNSGFDDNFGGDDYPEEEEPSEMDRYQSQADTPLTNKSVNRSGISSIGSEKRTPNTSRGTRTPGTGTSAASGNSRMSLGTTPGSHEFYRGRELSDVSYHGGAGGSDEEVDQSTDDEADTSAVITPVSGRKRGRKGASNTALGSDEEDPDASTFTEGPSFINNSLLFTINSGNKKYVEGRKKLQDAIKPAMQKKGRGAKKLYSSDEEEEGDQELQSESNFTFFLLFSPVSLPDIFAIDYIILCADSSDEVNSETGQPVRKSRRATKGRRFAFWKNERPLYEEGTMVGVLKAEPTPKKPKNGNRGRGRPKKEGGTSRPARSQVQDSDEEFAEETAAVPRLPAVRLPSRVNYLHRDECEELEVWDETMETQNVMKVVCVEENLQPVELPRTARRPHGKDKVGYAAHSFNVPEAPGLMSGWLSGMQPTCLRTFLLLCMCDVFPIFVVSFIADTIMLFIMRSSIGYVDLPPEAIKDAEGVGKYTQLFFVSDCQDGALELGLAHPQLDAWEDGTAQRMLLKKGDQFFIPPGNIYRLENHSVAKAAMLFWTIIKPIEEAANAEDDSIENSANSTSVVVPGAHGRAYSAVEMDSDM